MPCSPPVYNQAMKPAAESIDAYLADVDPERRAELERIRALVHGLVPGLTEKISYRMPTLEYKGRALVYFTASKKHLSFYPSSYALEELRDRLTGFKSTDHAVQFTLDKPLDDSLVEALVMVHKQLIDED